MGKNRGFTLIELMVMIMVLAVITVMAVPSFNNMLAKQNLNSSAQELITVLNAARSKAVIERRQGLKVQLSSSNTGTQVADSAMQLNWQPSGKAVLKSSITQIEFNINGGVVGATTDINFKICDQANGLKSKTVSISPMGIIQQTVEGTC